MYWSLFQAIVTLLLISYLYNSIALIGLPNVFIYGAFIFLTVYSYTELMDTRKISVFWESTRFVFGIGLLLYFGDWFGMNQFFSFASIIIASYLILSLVVTIYFVSTNFEKETLIVA
jgi:Flp pilus assembly protein protease CpaA